MENEVHIFSVYDPTTRFTKVLYVPVTPRDENPSNEQIHSATKKAQRYVSRPTIRTCFAPPRFGLTTASRADSPQARGRLAVTDEHARVLFPDSGSC